MSLEDGFELMSKQKNYTIEQFVDYTVKMINGKRKFEGIIISFKLLRVLIKELLLCIFRSTRQSHYKC